MSVFKNAYVRLGARSALVAGGAFFAQLQAADHVDASVLRAALLAGVYAGASLLFPWLNPNVGRKP